MGFMVYTIHQAEQWDEIVRSFRNHDVYYYSGYVKAFSLHGDGDPLLFYYNGGNLRGINVVMKRDIADARCFENRLEKHQWYDLATPYGYGGWLLEGAGDPEELYEAYWAWCRENRIVSEFVRFHPVLANECFAEKECDVVPLGGTIALDLSSPEIIWQNLTSKNRNMIRKAEKNNVQIARGQSAELFEVFRNMYNSTMDKDHAGEYYYFPKEFYESVREDLPQNAQLFYAQVPDGTIVAASIILAANGRLSYHLSGSLREYQTLAPTNLLLYEAALWGASIGYKTLHLGGGVGSGNDGLYQFKKSFYRGEPCRYHIGKRVFLPTIYQKLTELRETLPKSGFFPLYRA